jgi:hypothetical protein
VSKVDTFEGHRYSKVIYITKSFSQQHTDTHTQTQTQTQTQTHTYNVVNVISSTLGTDF